MANLDDLKVLGKGDFKALLKWRTALREDVCFLKLCYVFSIYVYASLVGLGSEDKAC
jgi:hypothetical protein